MKKIINPVKVQTFNGRSFNVFIEIEYINDKLSLCGVEGPLKSGNAFGSCGQIQDHLLKEDKIFVKGFDYKIVRTIQQIWNRYHLNDLKAECEHQKELGWDYENYHNTVNFIGESCPICDYKIGSAWNREKVPQWAIDYLFNLPDSKIQPAWV